MNDHITKIMIAMVSITLIGAIAIPAVAAQPVQTTTNNNINDGNIVAQQENTSQQSNETTTSTQDPTSQDTSAQNGETCDVDSAPELQTVDLHTSEETIDKDSPGQMSGTIVLDATAECPVTVQLTLNVPNNMHLEGSSDVGSGGGGVITNTFTVEPGEAKDLGATVYGNEIGQHTVTSQVTYFYQGHKDMDREIDGNMMTFTVEEPNMPDNGSAGSGGGVGGAGGLPPMKYVLAGLVGVAIIGLLAILFRKNKLKIST